MLSRLLELLLRIIKSGRYLLCNIVGKAITRIVRTLFIRAFLQLENFSHLKSGFIVHVANYKSGKNINARKSFLIKPRQDNRTPSLLSKMTKYSSMGSP